MAAIDLENSARTPRRRGNYRFLFLKAVIFGSLFGPLMGISLTAFFDPNSLSVFRGSVLFFWSPLEGIVWSLTFFILCGLGNAWLRPMLKGYPPSIIGTIHVVYNSIACSLGVAFVWAILSRFPPPMRIESPYLWRIVLSRSAILGAILARSSSELSAVKLKLQVERTQAELRRKGSAADPGWRAETARAQSLALQSQINPHFFFNTLNTISALVEIDPPAAQRTIGRLSDMFRYTLGCTHSGPVTLEQEVQFVRDYLSIEQARFQRRLRVELPETGLTSISVPGLVLQPLVENAAQIRHRRTPGGRHRFGARGAARETPRASASRNTSTRPQRSCGSQSFPARPRARERTRTPAALHGQNEPPHIPQ